MNTVAPQCITIATRESRLALWQAEYVKARLEAEYPNCIIELLGMTTRGDQILDRSLNKVGGKGLFVKELEVAMQEGRADIAVHSMKDVPAQMPDGFTLGAILQRDIPFDAFVSNKYASLADMPPGAVVGTSSLRREAQLHAQFPYLAVSPLRGNLDTRLRKLDEGQYDAIILAAAGLKRLGLRQRIRNVLSAEVSLPAAGQGAIGIEVASHRQDLLQCLQAISDAQTTACVLAERVVTEVLQGGCEVPIGAFALIDEDQLWLRALVARPDGAQIIRAEARGRYEHAVRIGHEVGQQLLAQGADRILSFCK